MKKIILLFVLSNCTILFSQLKLKSTYYSTHSGRNLSLGLSKNYKKIEVGGNLRININRLVHDNQGNFYKKRLYAQKPYQYFGAGAYVNYKVLKKWEHIHPFLFYDFQITRASTRNEMYSLDLNASSIVNYAVFKAKVEHFGPFTWMEQNIGVGFTANINDRLSFEQKAGIGTEFIIGHDDQISSRLFKKFGWELGTLLSIGLVYQLKE